MLKIHKKNIVEAKKHLGYHELSTFNLPDNRFDTLPLLEIIKIIEKKKAIQSRSNFHSSYGRCKY